MATTHSGGTRCEPIHLNATLFVFFFSLVSSRNIYEQNDMCTCTYAFFGITESDVH